MNLLCAKTHKNPLKSISKPFYIKPTNIFRCSGYPGPALVWASRCSKTMLAFLSFTEAPNYNRRCMTWLPSLRWHQDVPYDLVTWTNFWKPVSWFDYLVIFLNNRLG